MTPSEPCIESAIIYAATYHKDQYDRMGDPYIFHPLRVMEEVRIKGFDSIYQIVAVLHDVAEDTEATIDEVEMYFNHEIADAIAALTREGEEGYFSEYLPRVMENQIACVVKFYDAHDNGNRPGGLPGEAEKYMKVYSRCLTAAIDHGEQIN